MRRNIKLGLAFKNDFLYPIFIAIDHSPLLSLHLEA